MLDYVFCGVVVGVVLYIIGGMAYEEFKGSV